MVRHAFFVFVAFLILITTMGACNFAPDLGEGLFTCGVGGACPSGYQCAAADNHCYKPGSGPGTQPSVPNDGGGDGNGPIAPLSTIFVTDVSALEKDDDTGVAVFNVRLVPASSLEVTVAYNTIEDTAKAAVDYISATGTITFPPGTTSVPINVKLIGDRAVEPQKAFFLALSNPHNALLDTIARATGTIIDNDTPGLVVDDVTVAEGNTGLSSAGFKVTLAGTFAQPVTVSYATQDETALVGSDYISTSGTLTFKPGENEKTVGVPIKTDTQHGPDRTFFFNLSNAVGAPILDGQGKGTITDDDALPSLSISDETIVEGNRASSLELTVKLSGGSKDPVTVSFATSSGTATEADYTTATGAITFAPGTTSETIVIAIQGDTIDEPMSETFNVTLSQPVGASILKAVGVGTITDDDEPPIATISDVALAEGAAGQKTFAFKVDLSGPSGQTIAINYATRNETASAGSDYTAASGTLTFAPGELSKTINVAVNGDTVDEGVETFAVDLVVPVNGNVTLSRTSATGTILNDDSVLPSISIDDVAIAEGNAGITLATFTVTISPAVNQEVRVSYTTSNGTATSGSDYVSTSAELVFAPLQTTKAVSVAINGDLIYEPNETFFVDLFGAVNANIVDSQGLGTINNDEALPAITITGVAQNEGSSGFSTFAFPVTLTRASSQSISVAFDTVDGTAVAPADYTATSGTLTFAPGETAKVVAVSVRGGSLRELNETFTVTLSAPVNATIQTATATGTILNDDPDPTISITDSVVNGEGNAGTTPFSFTITLSNSSALPITVVVSTTDGTATAGSDYTAVPATTITFAPGETSKTFIVNVIGDIGDEPNETFSASLSLPTNATIFPGKGTGVATILNDDSPLPTVSIDDVAVTEGGVATFTITLSAASAQQVTVQYATADVTATTANGDYTGGTGTVTFAANVTTQTITVATTADATSEADETFVVNLSSPTNATIFDGQGQGTILNDDALPSITINDVAIAEGNAGDTSFVFTLSLSAAAGRDVTVNFATANGTALAGSDYEAQSGVVTIVAGATTSTVTIKVTGDVLSESSETFFVNLTNALNATIADAQGQGTITNDDAVPGLSIDDQSVVEGDIGNKSLTFTITLAAASGQACTVSYTTVDGTATAGNDYVASSGQLTIPANATSATISITISGDITVEGDETFTILLSNPTGCTITDTEGTGTILDND